MSPIASIIDGGQLNVPTADQWMWNLAHDLGSGVTSPIDADPVGAAMRISFDPSPITIRSMLDLGGQ